MVLSQNIRIGLFENAMVNTMVFHCTGGSYEVISDNKSILNLSTGDLLYLSFVDGKLSAHNGSIALDSLKDIRFADVLEKGSFSIKLVDPPFNIRHYNGNAEVKADNAVLQVVNELPLEKYLAGVAETEGGASGPGEYYKAQAVISRTFAMKHWNRHSTQGFNLCDGIHCQAYNGFNEKNAIILDAVLVTDKMVINDRNFNLINPSFHSNSGGETQRASDIWMEGEDYLQAVIDPFSEGQKNSTWKTNLGLNNWRKYIFSKMIGDTAKVTNEAILIQQKHREKYFAVGKDTILIGDIRNDMGFRSSFFSMTIKNDSVLVYGKGYGHGVGMSQEGAMEMARQGFSYSDILSFYYDMIDVSHIEDLPNSSLPSIFR